MFGDANLPEAVPLQDLDLLQRLTQYFDTIDHHLHAGHGWFIFNADGTREMRISSLLLSRLSALQPFVTYYYVPWREFSLNAYMIEVELQSIAPLENQLAGKAKTEFDIATRVSRDNMVKMAVSDLLVISGLRPAHHHELEFLDQTIERRYRDRLSTILLTPVLPDVLAREFAELDSTTPFWDRLFTRMYERSLIAV